MDRFLRYVKIDTQAVEEAGKVPSSDKQWNLARLLEKELKALGVQNVRISEHAIVYGLVPGNLPDNSKVPTIGFIAHMDTSPAVSGENVNAIIHKNYQGGDIVLPNDKTQVITVEKNPALKELIGDDIITADGTTLLGSDDKSGIAEIMTMIDILRNNPQFKHGNIAVAFTPDEEVGGGIDKFDVKGFGAKYAYTVDGGELGEISDETWTAKTATITFSGKSTHPGYAKDILVNSSFAAADYLSRFNDPKVPRPETTEGRVGFVHPYNSTLDIETSVVRVLLRNFEMSGVDEQEAMLRRMLDDTMKRFPNVAAKFDIRVGYLNMKEELKKYPQLVQFASDAAKRAGVTPKMKPIRGGTDGARLTFMGLPTPNLFTGGHNFHGKLEWNSRKGLERSTETLVNLVQIWAEKGGN
ncbi:MAG: peptidase T [Blastocatellia bacterium]|nr:peptidase T [Chloracidobacterium sp.]MBL8185357.1 peptidase T [Blastocatellia bacterium]HBE84168.1 peptidase T [Blastocatellia bacterium]